MLRPGDPVDARADRAVQGIVGVLLLGGFVFKSPWIVPVVAVVLAAGALGGPRANVLHRACNAWLVPRLPAPGPAGTPPATVAADAVRAQDALGTGILALATLVYLAGIALAGWLLAIGEAVIALVAATTGIHLADHLRTLGSR